MWRDMERLCADAGLPFQRPDVFPQRSVDAAKVALYALKQGWGSDFIRTVFTEHFALGHDIADHATLERAIAAAGQSQTIIEAALSAPSSLRTETEAAQANGVFGAPTFTVGQELFWGYDRMDQAIAWATRGDDATPRPQTGY